MNAIFDQPNNEDCWEILKLDRNKYITPVVSEGLLREYIFVPAKIGLAELENHFKNGNLKLKDFEIIKNDIYNCCSEMMKILCDSSITIKS